MTILVVGATGNTGKLLVEQLLEGGHSVKVIVRPSSKLPEDWAQNKKLSIIRANISGMSVEELEDHTRDCSAIASCLGHNLTLKGIYGQPRKLVTDAVKRLCLAVKRNSNEHKVKVILMNTSGNRNRDLKEPVPFTQKVLLSAIRLLLPPHSDNEHAADFLRTEIGQNHPVLEWVAVRPDSLIDQDSVTRYEVHPSPIRSALFNPGKTSRINVGNFMSKLLTDETLWNQWKGQMPVIYNKEIITD